MVTSPVTLSSITSLVIFSPKVTCPTWSPPPLMTSSQVTSPVVTYPLWPPPPMVTYLLWSPPPMVTYPRGHLLPGHLSSVVTFLLVVTSSCGYLSAVVTPPMVTYPCGPLPSGHLALWSPPSRSPLPYGHLPLVDTLSYSHLSLSSCQPP